MASSAPCDSPSELPAATSASATPPAGDSDSDHPEVTTKEVKAWYTIDFANSVFSTVGISGFLPLLVQSAALSNAGFPSVCPNIDRGATRIAELFPNRTGIDSIFLVTGYEEPACLSTGGPRCVNGWCIGLPANLDQCRDAGGLTPVAVRTTSGVDPSAYASLGISVSVGIQVFFFIALGSLADYGPLRKQLLLVVSVIGAIGSILCVGINSDTWWAGLPLMVLTNVAFGLSGVVYNAYLPKLVHELPSVRAKRADIQSATASMSGSNTKGLGSALGGETQQTTKDVAAMKEELAALELAESTNLSSRGFAWGYTAGVVGIVLCLPFALTLPEIQSYQAALVICGVWWAVFMYTPWRDLKVRPGPPLPPQSSYIRQSFIALKETVNALRGLPDTIMYLLAWAMFSDGVFVIGTLGGLFANSEVDWGCIPRAIGILAMFFLVPLMGAAGNMGFLWLAQKRGWDAKHALMIMLAGVMLLPLYAMLGYASKDFGVRKGWEIILLGAVYGLLMAPMQAFSRSLFATLVPRGKETACYSAYELTNRGSSWIGPTVLTVVQQYTGDMRRGFVYVFVAIGVGMVLLTRVDFVRGKRLASAAHPDGSPQPTTDATAAVLSTPQTVDMEMISVQNAPASS